MATAFGTILPTILLVGCATTPYPEEAKINLKAAIIEAAKALNGAGRYVQDNHLHVYGLRPAKATVCFNLAVVKEQGNKVEGEVSSPTGPAAIRVVSGWSATRRLAKDNHIEIVFTRDGKL